MTAIHWILLLFAGAVGVGIRGGLGWFMGPSEFPWATLIVNAVGGLLMGWVQGTGWMTDVNRPIIAVGLLGGMTTFSAFAWDSTRFLQGGQVVTFCLNLLANNGIAVGLCLLGYYLSRVTG